MSRLFTGQGSTTKYIHLESTVFYWGYEGYYCIHCGQKAKIIQGNIDRHLTNLYSDCSTTGYRCDCNGALTEISQLLAFERMGSNTTYRALKRFNPDQYKEVPRHIIKSFLLKQNFNVKDLQNKSNFYIINAECNSMFFKHSDNTWDINRAIEDRWHNDKALTKLLFMVHIEYLLLQQRIRECYAKDLEQINKPYEV